MATQKKRAGLPNPKSVVEERTFVPPAAARAAAPGALAISYRIIRTDEIDGYETPVPRAAIAAIGAPAGPPGDSFAGTARKAAKLSIASGAPDEFADLKKLVDGLPSESAMKKHKPPIGTDATSGRVAEEKHNVRVQAFLYAASREPDNDFHLIIGRDRAKSPALYMTVEVSGLPPSSATSFARLKKARDGYKAFFADKLPGATYDFYDPPVPVEVEGSLFFDMSHAGGEHPGPKSLRSKMPTIWEIHPISRIVFEP